jgi:hypothetical protein
MFQLSNRAGSQDALDAYFRKSNLLPAQGLAIQTSSRQQR